MNVISVTIGSMVVIVMVCSGIFSAIFAVICYEDMKSRTYKHDPYVGTR